MPNEVASMRTHDRTSVRVARTSVRRSRCNSACFTTWLEESWLFYSVCGRKCPVRGGTSDALLLGMATGSKYDAVSTESSVAASKLAKLSWRPIACWGSIKLHRAADDTHTVAKVEVLHAMLATRDLYLVTESYDGRVELATICENKFEAARLFVFHVRMIDPMGMDRNVGTKVYQTHEASKGTFTDNIREERKNQRRREAELRRRVIEAKRARMAAA